MSWYVFSKNWTTKQEAVQGEQMKVSQTVFFCFFCFLSQIAHDGPNLDTQVFETDFDHVGSRLASQCQAGAGAVSWFMLWAEICEHIMS